MISIKYFNDRATILIRFFKANIVLKKKYIYLVTFPENIFFKLISFYPKQNFSPALIYSKTS